MGFAIAVAALAAGCAGPCKAVQAERRALAARTAHTTDAHARIQIPYAIANRLIAEALQPAPELAVPLDRLGPLAMVIGDVRAVPREVVLGPAAPGRVRVDVRIELRDRRGELLTVRAWGELAPVIERGTPPALVIAFDADQLSRFEPDLGARATEHVGQALEDRLPAVVRSRVPRTVIDAVAAAIVEQAIDHGYRVLRKTLLPRLGELTRLRLELPDVPMERVDLASLDQPVPALELAVHTTLPVGSGVTAWTPAGDAIEVQVAGGTVAAAANWGIASGRLPARYTRKLKPASDGAYVPHFEWRTGDPQRPLVVHMFKIHGGCAHFAAASQPHVEVRDGQVRGWVTNRELEHADGPLVLELLARLDNAVQRSRSPTKQRPGTIHLTVGGRDVTTHLVRAEITGDQVRAALAVSIAPAATPRAARASRDSAAGATPQRPTDRYEASAQLARSPVAWRVDDEDAQSSRAGSCPGRGR